MPGLLIKYETGAVPEQAPPPPPPEPPLKPVERFIIGAGTVGELPPIPPYLPPPPPPAEVIVEKTELAPLFPGLTVGPLPAPPPPTVTGYPCAETGKALTQAPKGEAV